MRGSAKGETARGATRSMPSSKRAWGATRIEHLEGRLEASTPLGEDARELPCEAHVSRAPILHGAPAQLEPADGFGVDPEARGESEPAPVDLSERDTPRLTGS